MDNRISGLLFAALICAAVFCIAPDLDASISFVENGKVSGSIVIGDTPCGPLAFNLKVTDGILYAAEFLQKHIEKATGAVIPIKRESEGPQAPYILVGRTAMGEKLGISAKGLPAEGYLVKSFKDGVAIVGEISQEGIDRGTLNGIYRFLEDTLGIRWYFAPEEMGAVIPPSSSLNVPDDFSLSGHPFFPYRMGGISHWQGEVAQQWHPALRFGSSKGMGANHTHENWYKYYGKEHPEYFALKEDGTRAVTSDRASSGQNRSYLCFSEPGVLRQHIENVDEYFKTGNDKPWVGGVRPQGNNIPFGPNDVSKILRMPRMP